MGEAAGNPGNDISPSKKAKEIEVIEVEYENYLFSDNERVVRRNFQMACALGANMMMLCYGLVVPSSGFLIPQLEDPQIGFGISVEEGSWLASIMVAGSLTGALCGGMQCGKLGRKRSMLIDCFFFIIGTLLMTFSINLYMILIGRFVQGHSAASSMVAVPMYTSETSQPAVRKHTGSFPTMCYTCGFGLALVLGALFPWRYAIGCVLVAPMGCGILLTFCPETPTWLVSQGREDEAKKALIKLRGESNMDIVEAEFNRIVLNLKLQQKLQLVENNGEEKTHGKWEAIKDGFKSFADPTFVKPFAYLCAVFLVGFEMCGFPAIGFYMVPLLQEAEIPFDPYWAAAMLASYRGMMSILSSSFSAQCKKRPTYFCCGGLLISGLLTISAYTYFNQNKLLTENFPIARWIPIFSILIIYTAFSFGWGSIPYALQGELLPARARSFGAGLLGFVDNLVLFFVTKSVPSMFALLGVHGTFLLSACCASAMLIVSFFCMPETMGMTLEEIEDMYRPKSKKQLSPK